LAYLYTNQLDSAEYQARQWRSEYPKQPGALMALGRVLKAKGMDGLAKSQFEKADSLITKNGNWSDYQKIIISYQLGKVDSLQSIIDNINQKVIKIPKYGFLSARAFAVIGNNAMSLKCLELAFQNGWKPAVAMDLHHPDLYYLRQTPEYKALVKKYFPDQFKK
jgi:hypothetical protein